MSTADTIATALTTALGAITTAPYATDIGTRVFQGRKRLSDAAVPCVVIFEGEEQIEDGTRRQFKNTTRYVIEGFDVCDPDNPNVKAREIVADIKKCIFGGDLTLGGVAKALAYRGRVIGENEDGTNFVSAQVLLDVTYADTMVG